MTIFPVPQGKRVTIASSVDAAYPQRFIIQRQSTTNPELWEGMGQKTYAGSASPSFAADAADRMWSITCQNKNKMVRWVYSQERSTGVGTMQILIVCDDDMTGDGDFNDLVLRIKLKDSGEGGDTSKEETGDGKFMPPFPPSLGPYPK